MLALNFVLLVCCSDLAFSSIKSSVVAKGFIS